MNVMNRLTLRQLRLNKKRTGVTLIGVIISVAMITAVTTLGTSFMDLMQRNAKASNGNWHVLYPNVTPVQAEKLAADKKVEAVSLIHEKGYASLPTSRNPDKPYLFVREFNADAFDRFPVQIKEGRLPATDSELALSEHMLTNGGAKVSIGDELTLVLGERQVEGVPSTKLGQNEPLQTDSSGGAAEKLVSQERHVYKVVGIIKRPVWEPTWAPGYTALSHLDLAKLNPTETVSASTAWKHVTRGIFEQARELGEQLKISDVQFNNPLLRYYGITGTESLQRTLYLFLGVVLTIIVIGSVSLVYNAFAISVAERSRQLGMLSSIGATRKQKRKSVIFEGAVIGLISIPIGLAAGLAGMAITFLFVNPLLASTTNIAEKLLVKVSPASLLMAVLVSAATLFISTYSPARRASRISPIEAIRQSQEIKLTNKNVKTSRLTRRLFGFEAEIGLKNLKRNRRRYRATVFSLIVSLVLFLTVSTFTYYMGISVNMSQDDINYDMQVSLRTNSGNAEQGAGKDFASDKIALFNKITQFEKVEESSIVSQLYGFWKATPDQEMTKPENASSPEGVDGNLHTVQVIGLTEATFAQYALEVGAAPASLTASAQPAAIVVDRTFGRVNGKFVEIQAVRLSVGENLRLVNPPDEKLDKQQELGDVKVSFLTNKMPLGVTNAGGASFTVVLPLKQWESFAHHLANTHVQPNVLLFLNSKDPIGLQSDIEKWEQDRGRSELQIWNVYKNRQQNRQLMQILNIFSFGFVALITAIATANIFNTISTSIALRKREFAMLRSVGMTPRGFNKMIRFESLFYGIKTLLYGLPISFLIMLLLFGSLSGSFRFEFGIPWHSVFISIGAVFLIVGSSMLYSAAKIRNENILDGLRTENL
ncbi:FtsX-like permease family protein [Gorillibacterium sp. CAU 1737]|uniref:FtsX-like permease family protein n=1 Tax=Gorillibacterium sp. CAU 1737 TaxID=3140362 RepID=UPI0032602553